VAFNIAIFSGGIAGAVLITFDDGLGLPTVMIALPLVALCVAFAARRSAFPPRRSARRLHVASDDTGASAVDAPPTFGRYGRDDW
jgi:hypothetical protein